MQKVDFKLMKTPPKMGFLSPKNIIKDSYPGNSMIHKIYFSSLNRKDVTYLSCKNLPVHSKPNQGTQSANSDNKESTKNSESSTEEKDRMLIKKPSVSSVNSDGVAPSQITNFEQEVILRGIKAPSISSKAWAVAKGETGEVIFGHRQSTKKEVASITKVMTCYCVCRLLDKHKIDPKDTFLEISPYATTMIGTSANLKKGDVLCVWDLLHGLMLPSGNDAAYCLAESFGTFIFMQTQEYKVKSKTNPSFIQGKGNIYIKYFLEYMNEISVELELVGTKYSNPHGLCDNANLTTAADIAKLAACSMKNPIFREVVKQQNYSCVVDQCDGFRRTVTWENTNKLLTEGWEGIKTGITTAAGPCFCGAVTIDKANYIVIVLDCRSMDARWDECKTLVNWVHKTRELLIK